ncbi:GGDEF domain-containing protein [Ectothiorhodospira sp. 9100]|uniref:GGDEF domain-containing protein n=2 Tax=unclassified Ectothiorhodospira TaxID=2684909 RepID=UPI001EE7B352|nr:GGDEF domain-containing protein [Ectothiorhodospira sp. 9100]MCG5514523.1 diguanylate cyclase [Ectothiorhodospira sp. 9100]MCG5518673.1 diguanylate cyclase [Ectothiorhodospira sp. 9905]
MMFAALRTQLCRPTLTRTIVLAVGLAMILIAGLAVMLTIQGAHQANLHEVHRSFDGSAAIASLILDKEIESAERATSELLRFPALRQAVHADDPETAMHLLTVHDRLQGRSLFDALVIAREGKVPWVASGFALRNRGPLLRWLAQQADTTMASPSGLVVVETGEGESIMALVTQGSFRDPESGRAVGQLLGLVALSDRISVFTEMRARANLTGVGLVLDGQLFPGPSEAALQIARLEEVPIGDPEQIVMLDTCRVAWRHLKPDQVVEDIGIVMSTTGAGQDASILIRTVSMLAVLILLVMGGLLVFLTRSIAIPMRDLSIQTRQSPAGPFSPLAVPRLHRYDELGQVVGAFNDLIERIGKHQMELDRIAHYDPLTGVPNRRLLADRMEQAIARSRRDGGPLAICYLDLDGFKPINDRHGHAMGDQLLLAITARLRKLLRVDDTLARLGGDEFVILFNNLHTMVEADQALSRLLEAVAEPVMIEGEQLEISASVGVTFYPQDEADPDTLLRHADQAMYQAKASGRNRYHFFESS